MRAVVTGATGAVGVALVNHLQRDGCHVLVLTHQSSKRISRLHSSNLVEIAVCGMEDYQVFNTAQRYDVFFHLAWSGGHIRNNIETNLKSMIYSIEAVSLAKRLGCSVFIGAGTQAECGRTMEKISADTPCLPESPYAVAKLGAYQMTKFKCEELGIRHIWARILSIYGPFDGEQTMLISSIRRLLKHEPVAFTRGEQEWDFLYANDAAEALFLLAIKGHGDCIYSIGSGIAWPLKKYIRIMCKKMGHSSTLGLGIIPYHEKEVMFLCADLTALTQDTGWSPKTSFEEGIEKTIRYCIENPIA